jgi:hypothetical protein
MTGFWRERVGIEPTRDSTCPSLGFEDRDEHQNRIRSQSAELFKMTKQAMLILHEYQPKIKVN